MRELPVSVRGYLRSVVSATRTQLGPDLVGVYAVGSIALSDFQIATSDVDLIVVSAASLAMTRRRRLADALEAVPIPVRGLEYVLYPLAALEHVASTPAWDLNLNVGPRLAARHETFNPADELRYWAILDLAVARQSGVALEGPSASHFPHVPRQWIVDALRESMTWHDTDDRASPNRVLNTSRALYWAVQDRFVSKSVAAEWAFTRTGDPLIPAAAEARATGAGQLDAAAVDALAARLRREFERAVGARS